MSITSLRVTSDIIGASYTNGTTGNVIYSFFPNVGPGYKIVKAPVNLVFLPIRVYSIDDFVDGNHSYLAKWKSGQSAGRGIVDQVRY